MTHDEALMAVQRALRVADAESRHAAISLPGGMVPTGLRLEVTERGALSGASQRAAWQVLVTYLLERFADDLAVVSGVRSGMADVVSDSEVQLLAVRPFDAHGEVTEAFCVIQSWTETHSAPGTDLPLLTIRPPAGLLQQVLAETELEMKVDAVHRRIERRARRELTLRDDLPHDWVARMVHALKSERTDGVQYRAMRASMVAFSEGADQLVSDLVDRWTVDPAWAVRRSMPVDRWTDRELDKWALEAAAVVCGLLAGAQYL